jgi:cation diffusion facilitator family transporter
MTAHRHDLRPFAHAHDFADASQAGRERALLAVTLLTLATMVLELVTGWLTSSLALTADGWHMGTHALALGGAVLAYRLSRRAATQSGYAFGGWKIEVLAAYTSGLLLLGVAAWLAWEGVAALRQPRAVDHVDALVVAVIGLVVNLASVALLARGGHAHGDHHDHGHGHHDHHDHHHDHDHGQDHPGHHDHNFRAAYLHVLADAFTSLLAIGALVGGAWFGLGWLDPAVALLGAAVIAQWSWRMLRSTARALVDATQDPQLAARIRDCVQADGDAQVADLHVWQVGSRAWCAALSVVADQPLPAVRYRERLDGLAELRHVTVEVHRCTGASGDAAPAQR